MGREFPVGENIPVIHPIVSVSLFIACIAATIAIVSSLCGSQSKKKSQPSSAAENEMKENKDVNVSLPVEGAPSRDSAVMAQGTGGGGSENEIDIAEPQYDEELQQQQLPPPPGMHHLSDAASYHIRSNSTTHHEMKSRSHSTASKMKMKSSMSMRVLGNAMSSRQASKREDNDKSKDKKLKHEDSIWKKRIILGEKCRIPDEDDDTILYDEKGRRISTYHPKNTNSMVLSRQSSNIDSDALPN